MSEFPIQISPDALIRLKKLIERDGRPGAFLRIGVKGGGCSGLEYVTRIETSPHDNDLVSEFEGLVVRCDPKSAKFLQGSILEYSGNLVGGGYQFRNPNAARSCGCGTSFTPKS